MALTEAEKRMHRCCFAGPEKIPDEEFEEKLRKWLDRQINAAAAAGYRTFVCGMTPGTDLLAGTMVRQKRDTDPSAAFRLICAPAWPDFSEEMSFMEGSQARFLLNHADYVKQISRTFHEDVFQERNRWIVQHCSRLIVWYDGRDHWPLDMIQCAMGTGVEIISNEPDEVAGFMKWLEQEKDRYVKPNGG